MTFSGDADYVRTRWLADPKTALGAEIDGKLVGSNFATRWGSVAFSDPCQWSLSGGIVESTYFC